LDIRNYIESGIIEAYVLGKLTPEEASGVEDNALLYPGIRQEIDTVERAMEQYAWSYAKTPPPGMLHQILQRIDQLPPTTPASPPATAVPPSFLSSLRPRSWARFLAVGMTVKFLLAATGLGVLYYQNQQLHDRFESKQAQLYQAQASCDSISSKLERSIFFLKDVNTQPVVMTGQPIAPQATAAVHFNPIRRKAYLTNLELPKPPAGKQYQLWAIVAGAPVSMGVFEVPDESGQLLEVPFVENASAFAISLEDTGGKPQPTMDQIFVIGAIAG
jgi:anti-sigma-K factor RskA